MAEESSPRATGCRAMRRAWAGMEEDQRDFLRERIRDYPHLYPCPKMGFNWRYKRDCEACAEAEYKPGKSSSETSTFGKDGEA